MNHDARRNACKTAVRINDSQIFFPLFFCLSLTLKPHRPENHQNKVRKFPCDVRALYVLLCLCSFWLVETSWRITAGKRHVVKCTRVLYATMLICLGVLSAEHSWRVSLAAAGPKCPGSRQVDSSHFPHRRGTKDAAVDKLHICRGHLLTLLSCRCICRDRLLLHNAVNKGRACEAPGPPTHLPNPGPSAAEFLDTY